MKGDLERGRAPLKMLSCEGSHERLPERLSVRGSPETHYPMSDSLTLLSGAPL